MAEKDAADGRIQKMRDAVDEGARTRLVQDADEDLLGLQVAREAEAHRHRPQVDFDAERPQAPAMPVRFA